MDSAEKRERAAKVLSAALRIIERRGTWKPVGVKGSEIKVLGFESGSLLMLYATPFQNLPTGLPDEAGYVLAQSGRLPPASRFSLNIWNEKKKVLFLAWDDPGDRFEMVSFKPGRWEMDLLILASRRPDVTE